MNNLFFEVERSGIFSTFQDSGFANVQHLGITTGGVMDSNLFKISNKLLNNHLNETAIEFAYQGPKLKLVSGKTKIVIAGDVYFKIIRKNKIETNKVFYPFQTYNLHEGDILDIIATKNSIYGYLAIKGGFKLKKYFSSGSTNVRSMIGPNGGKKIKDKQKIYFLKSNDEKSNYRLNYKYGKKTNIIRIIKGPQIHYFEKKIIKKFILSRYIISNNIDRMGIRLNGHKITSYKSSNIQSEGIVKGSIQVPADGNPIVLMSDHPTIGGYPKIATVIFCDIPKLSQLSPGKQIFFKFITLLDAEKELIKNTKFLNEIFQSIETIY